MEERLIFDNKKLFGQRFDSFPERAFGVVTKLYLSGIIDSKGHIAESVDLTQVWSYIYFMIQHNRDVFKAMTSKGRRMSAKNLYTTIQKETQQDVLDVPVLVKYVNGMVEREDVNNPLLCSSRVFPLENVKLKELELLKTFLKTKYKFEYKNIAELANALRQKAPQIAVNCDQDIQNLAEMSIYSKMCMLKILGTLLGENYDFGDSGQCSNEYSNMKLDAPTQAFYLEKYQSVRDVLLSYKEMFNAKKYVCSDLEKYRNDLETSALEMNNLLEDLAGATRVYVKIRPFLAGLDDEVAYKSAQVTIIGRELGLKCGALSFGPKAFYGVFPEAFKNADAYIGSLERTGLTLDNLAVRALKEDLIKQNSLYRSFKQIEAGYNICLFSYGHSGSGKTRLLFGGGEEPGILHYGLRNLKGVQHIHLHQVFELYYAACSPNDLMVRSKVIVSYDRSKEIIKDLEKFGVAKNEIDLEPTGLNLDHVHLSQDNIQEKLGILTDQIRAHMTKQSRIKKTKNNPESSRSHLFMVFRIAFANGENGFLTCIDCAGAEDPISIYRGLFNSHKFTLAFLLRQFDDALKYKGDLKNMTLGDYLTDPGIANDKDKLVKGSLGEIVFKRDYIPKIESSLQRNIQIVQEGFLINETLLHLKYFFKRRNNQKVDFKQQEVIAGNIAYSPSKIFKNPAYEDIGNPAYRPGGKSRVLMIPILNYIDSLSRGKMSKYIMMTAVRRDKCAETINSLHFAADISS